LRELSLAVLADVHDNGIGNMAVRTPSAVGSRYLFCRSGFLLNWAAITFFFALRRDFGLFQHAQLECEDSATGVSPGRRDINS
jgi:hypothetical protein